MKISQFVILFFLFAVLINCSDDEAGQETVGINPPEETSEVIFKLNVSSDIITSTGDDWIIVHNDRGELIDYSAYESGDEITIEAESALVTENITITTFLANSRDGIDKIIINTYTEIAKGSTWNFKHRPEPPNLNELRGEQAGSFDVTTSNLPPLERCVTSHSFGAFGGSFCESTTSIPLYKNISEYMISVFENDGTCKYMFLDSSPNGANVNIDYAEFNEFDSFVNVDTPSGSLHSILIFGYNDDQEIDASSGFHLNRFFIHTSRPIRLGYLNRFNKYYTNFNFRTDTYHYGYKKYGEKPLKIEPPENPSLRISNTTIKDFDFTTSIDFIRRTSSWELLEGIRNQPGSMSTLWTVHSANQNKHSIGNIPDEILSKYPKIKINDLTYSNTRLHLSFDSYSEYIEKKFVSTQINSRNESYERVSFSN